MLQIMKHNTGKVDVRNLFLSSFCVLTEAGINPIKIFPGLLANITKSKGSLEIQFSNIMETISLSSSG